MFNKLRQNYMLSSVLIQLAFVIAYVFYSWQECIATAQLILSTTNSMLVLVGIFASMLMGIILMFLVPFAAGLFLQASRFYNIPRAEYGLLAQLFCIFYYLLCGAFRLLNLATPLLLNWGQVLFPFAVSLCCVVGFYRVTSQLYFNDVTRPYYFRNMAIVYFVCAVAFEVLL